MMVAQPHIIFNNVIKPHPALRN